MQYQMVGQFVNEELRYMYREVVVCDLFNMLMAFSIKSDENH
jgi:hypothetical protein